MKLTENFSLEEFIHSTTAMNSQIDNNPTAEVVENIERLTRKILQPLREKIASPVKISSGYRSKELNDMIGGEKNSQHLEGKAADIIVPGQQLFEIYLLLFKEFEFDQLIFEMNKWIHVSYNEGSNRAMALIAYQSGGKVRYKRYGR